MCELAEHVEIKPQDLADVYDALKADLKAMGFDTESPNDSDKCEALRHILRKNSTVRKALHHGAYGYVLGSVGQQALTIPLKLRAELIAGKITQAQTQAGWIKNRSQKERASDVADAALLLATTFTPEGASVAGVLHGVKTSRRHKAAREKLHKLLEELKAQASQQ